MSGYALVANHVYVRVVSKNWNFSWCKLPVVGSSDEKKRTADQEDWLRAPACISTDGRHTFSGQIYPVAAADAIGVDDDASSLLRQLVFK